MPLFKKGKKKLTIKYNPRTMQLKILRVPEGYEYEVEELKGE